MTEKVKDVLQTIARHINCLSDENRNSRKRAMEGIRKETLGLKPTLDAPVFQAVFNEIAKPVLKLVSDPVEKCRELAIMYIADVMKQVDCVPEYLPYIIPVFVQRLGQQEIVEPSEELRLEIVLVLSTLIELSQKAMAPYLDDVIKILQRTIADQFPELKKESCRCACKIARAIPPYFHQQSETLIKPLNESISHQHSKVRVEVVLAIG